MSTTHTEAPKRLRAADVIETLETALHNVTNRPASEPSASVEITRNAKGEPQFTVKVYASASAEEAVVRRVTGLAYDQAVQAFESLRESYPFEGAPAKPADAKATAAIASRVARNAERAGR